MEIKKFNFYNYIHKDRSKDIFYAKEDFELLKGMIQKYCEKHPNATNDEIRNEMREFITNLTFDLKDFSSPRSNTIKYYTYKRFVRNKDLFKATYEKIIKEENGTPVIYEKSTAPYSNNIEDANEMLVKEFLDIERQFKLYTEKNKDYYLKHKEETENYILENFGATYLKYFKYKCKGKDAEALYTLLFSKDIQVPNEEDLKENYIHIIEKVGKRLDQFGELERDNENNNRIMKRYEMDGLTYPMESTNKEETFGIRDIFKKENLDKLSLLQVASLESFWLNRYAKVLESLSNSLFIADQFNLFENLKNNEDVNLSNEEINYVFQKQNVLYGISKDFSDALFSSSSDKLKDELVEKAKNNGSNVVSISSDKLLDKVFKKMSTRYNEHFSSINPNFSNNIEEDYDRFYCYNSAKCVTYQMKDYSMEAIIYNIMNQEKKLNWGVNENTINSKRVVLSLDTPGLNMPIRLHIDKDRLIKFFNESQGNAIIPIYDGRQDFDIGSRTLSTSVLLPLRKKQKEFVKQELREDEDIKNEKINKYPRNTSEINFLEHINYLGNFEEYPKHLGRPYFKKVKGKKVIVYKQKPYEYIDLSTLKRYRKNEKQEFVEEDQKARE